MLRVHSDNYVPKYQNGVWLWNEAEDRLDFASREEITLVKEEFVYTNDFKFLAKINQLEELIFRQEFQRADNTHDADVILIQDIKNYVLFIAPKSILTVKLIKFLHTRTANNFLHALIIYMSYFLKVVEFLLIRRDEIAGDLAQLQSEESVEMKRIFSQHLSQYRVLLAREYSIILLGLNDTKPFYHMKCIVNISQTIKDKAFHEAFLAVCTQIVWICNHRRAYDVINMEMNRLFRSDHFKLTRSDSYQYTQQEAAMLYGKNYKRRNYRAQNSPLIQELMNVSNEDAPLLMIGRTKYRGTDFRILQIELEYIVPPSQLCLIDVDHGILGHPKRLYNTMLELNWEAVRFQNYSQTYDPYCIVRQPHLQLPNIDELKLRKQCEQFASFYNIVDTMETVPEKELHKWTKRDQIIEYFTTKGFLTNVWTKCEKEINDTSYGPSVEQIITEFLARKEKLRKK